MTTDHRTATKILWYMMFMGFAVNYMQRINVNIAIVDMVSPKQRMKKFNTTADQQCHNDTTEYSSPHMNVTLDGKFEPIRNRSISIERAFFDYLQIDYPKNGFEWNEKDQNMLLGCFYWLYALTPIPGGIFARKYGTKKVLGYSLLIGSFLCLLFPALAYVDFYLAVLIRTFHGFILGVCPPTIHHMATKWIPPNERSSYFTCILGTSIGVAVFYPLFGYIIAHFSWEYVYYICAACGFLWFGLWQYLVYDSPAEHPRIHPAERIEIENALDKSTSNQKKLKTPWMEILTSRIVWVIVFFQFGTVWGIQTILTQAPTYFKIILGWNIGASGLIAGIPHVTKIFFGHYFSKFADYLLRTNKMSRRNVRIFGGTVTNILFGCFFIGLAYSGCNSMAAIIFSILATTCHGAISAGSFANIADISPNFSGIIMGVATTIAILPGFISPYIVGQLTFQNQTVEQWRLVFLISGGVLITSGILYVIFTDTNVQSWNEPKKNDDFEKELVLLKVPVNGVDGTDHASDTELANK